MLFLLTVLQSLKDKVLRTYEGARTVEAFKQFAAGSWEGAKIVPLPEPLSAWYE